MEFRIGDKIKYHSNSRTYEGTIVAHFCYISDIPNQKPDYYLVSHEKDIPHRQWIRHISKSTWVLVDDFDKPLEIKDGTDTVYGFIMNKSIICKLDNIEENIKELLNLLNDPRIQNR